MLELIYLLLIPVIATMASLMVIRPPRAKRARRGRANRHAGVNETDQVDNNIDPATVVLDPANGFDQNFLNNAWPNAPAGQPTTWLERIVAGLNYWLNIKDVSPSDEITTNKSMQTHNAFSVTERAWKNGIASIVVMRVIYGRETRYLRHAGADGGMLYNLRGEGPIYDNVVVPLVNLLVNKFNTISHKGLMLEYGKIMNMNFTHWHKSTLKRAQIGSWSNEEVETILVDDNHEFHGDTDICKGLFYPWFLTLCQFIPEFYADATKHLAGHHITEAQNQPATWATELNRALPI
jgi:hypothetical protein